MSALLEQAQAKADMLANRQSASSFSNPSRGWSTLDALPEVTKTPPEPFPFDGLGEVLGDAARSIATDVQAPDALAGGSVLATAALVSQPHADVVMPHGQRVPLSLYILSSCESGDRKSATDRVAGDPIDEHRREQARQYAQEFEAYEAERANKAKGDPEPKPPAAKSLTVGKATVEGMVTMLRHQPHIGLFTAEGGELLGGHSMREERRSAGLACLLKAWGGETLDSLTRGDGFSILVGRRVSIHAMAQPILLRQLLSDPLAQGQGFLSRCLIAEPQSLAGTRLFRACDPTQSAAVQRYYSALQRLLSRPPPVCATGDGSELQPLPLVMSGAASGLWIQFYNQIETAQAEGLDLQGARAFGSKTAEHAARIAGVVEMLGDPDARQVGEESMAGALQVASFYLGEHLRLTGASSEHRHLVQLHGLLEWMRTRGGIVSSEDVLQRSPNPLRKLKSGGLKPLLDELAQRGYVRPAGKGWEVRP